jgi:hypothetical protein
MTIRIAFISSYVPRRCGIATFTSDLLDAARAADPATTGRVAAIDEPSVLRPYRSEVRWRIRQGVPGQSQDSSTATGWMADTSTISCPCSRSCASRS